MNAAAVPVSHMGRVAVQRAALKGAKASPHPSINALSCMPLPAMSAPFGPRSCPMKANPPRGHSRMLSAWPPTDRAAAQWPSSCTRTDTSSTGPSTRNHSNGHQPPYTKLPATCATSTTRKRSAAAGQGVLRVFTMCQRDKYTHGSPCMCAYGSGGAAARTVESDRYAATTTSWKQRKGS